MEVKSPLQTDILNLTEADIKDLAKMHLLVPQDIGSPKPASKQYLNNMAISEEGKQAGACVTEVLFHHPSNISTTWQSQRRENKQAPA